MYDIIVVGGGHAGCEAAYACAKKNHKTLLMTSNIKNIADMPCNPHIGGSAKGIVVREIDALGGIMGKVADKTHLQIKMLNSAKGPAVQSLRAQGDKIAYPKEMMNVLTSLENLTIQEGMVEDLIVEEGKGKGIVLEDGTKIESQIVILTTGTYLKADILVGNTRTRKGPHDERPSNFLSEKLAEYKLLEEQILLHTEDMEVGSKKELTNVIKIANNSGKILSCSIYEILNLFDRDKFVAYSISKEQYTNLIKLINEEKVNEIKSITGPEQGLVIHKTKEDFIKLAIEEGCGAYYIQNNSVNYDVNLDKVTIKSFENIDEDTLIFYTTETIDDLLNSYKKHSEIDLREVKGPVLKKTKKPNR